MKISVKMDAIVRAMDKKVFNNEVVEGDEVTILKPMPYDNKDAEGKIISTTYSFICKLTRADGTSEIVSLPGKVLFSAQVLKSTEGGTTEDIPANYESFMSRIGGGETDEGATVELDAFTNFTVKHVSDIPETRANVLAKYDIMNVAEDRRKMYALRDYARFAELLKLNKGKYDALLDYDAIYESGPISASVTPLKNIQIALS